MTQLSRRVVVSGGSFAAALALAGCTDGTPGPIAAAPSPDMLTKPAAMAALGEPYNRMYARVDDARFPLPAVKLSAIDPAYLRKRVAYATNQPAGTIVIDPRAHYLYFVEPDGQAMRYGVGVGREGFAWAGEATINSKQEWPDWYPPKEMLERQPTLKKAMSQLQSGIGMPGGPGNPLGARAMYLWQGKVDTLFRIHGTTEPASVGKSVSSGCIRMINQDAADLYTRVTVGTRVVVLGRA